jgi:nitroreductase
MDLYDVIRRRRMVRAFQDRPIDPEVVERILGVAVHAPSAGFSQGWGFLVCEGEDARRFFDVSWPGERGAHADVARAPLVIVPCSNKQMYLDRYAEPDKGWTDRDESHWPVPYWDIDTGFASMLMLLAVVNEGLGAVFFGLQREAEVKEAFGIPETYRPIGAIAVGHSAPDVRSPSLARGRRGVDDVVHRGRW